MPTMTNPELMAALEKRIRFANQAIQFNSIARDLKRLGDQLEQTPNFDRARYYFLKGVFFTKATLLDQLDVHVWMGNSSEALAHATGQFAESVRIVNTIRSYGTDAATLAQITLLERIATWEYAVAYTALRARKEALSSESMLSMECLGPDSRKRITKALARGRRIESKFYRL